LGTAPSYVRRAWVWKIPPGGLTNPPAAGTSLARCRAAAPEPLRVNNALAMADCVLSGAKS
jgi:hypothetical protein